jgi:hypothetical protein
MAKDMDSNDLVTLLTNINSTLSGLVTRMDAIEARDIRRMDAEEEEEEEKKDGPTSPVPKKQRTASEHAAIEKYKASKGDEDGEEEEEEEGKEDGPTSPVPKQQRTPAEHAAIEKKMKSMASGDADEDEEEEEEEGDAEEEEEEEEEEGDAEEEEEEEEEKDQEEEEEEIIKTDRRKRADARRDSEVAQLRKRVRDLEIIAPRQITDKTYQALLSAQAKADPVYAAFGDQAPRPLLGEDLNSYRRRMAKQLKKHSDKWKGVNLSSIADSVAFKAIEAEIYSDALKVAMSPKTVPQGHLRAITKNQDGHIINEYIGDSSSWMGSFSAPAIQYVSEFLTPNNKQ